MSDYQYCTVVDEGRVRIVTINRPEVMNALHSEAHWEFDRMWNEFAATGTYRPTTGAIWSAAELTDYLSRLNNS